MNSLVRKIKIYSYSKYAYLRRFGGVEGYFCHVGNKNISSSANERSDDVEYKEEWRKEEEQHGYDQLYPGYIPTTLFQKSLLAVGSGITAIVDPARDDMVSAFGETTGYFALKRLREKMLNDPVGRQILEERPVLNSSTLDIDYLGTLKDGTFGKQYWKFLTRNGFSPDARQPVHFLEDEHLQYVMLRYRQVHDLFHTVLGMPPHMLGEVIVKKVEAIQTGLPMCVLAATFGPIRLGPMHRKKYFSTFLPWAVKCGTNAKFLMAVYFEKHWEDDLKEFRKELNVIDPPPGIGRKKKQS